LDHFIPAIYLIFSYKFFLKKTFKDFDYYYLFSSKIISIIVIFSGAEDKIMYDYKVKGQGDVTSLHAMVQASGKMVLVHKLLPKLLAGGHKVSNFIYFRRFIFTQFNLYKKFVSVIFLTYTKKTSLKQIFINLYLSTLVENRETDKPENRDDKVCALSYVFESLIGLRTFLRRTCATIYVQSSVSQFPTNFIK
jgi:hypothetical protein